MAREGRKADSVPVWLTRVATAGRPGPREGRPPSCASGLHHERRRQDPGTTPRRTTESGPGRPTMRPGGFFVRRPGRDLLDAARGGGEDQLRRLEVGVLVARCAMRLRSAAVAAVLAVSVLWSASHGDPPSPHKKEADGSALFLAAEIKWQE